MMASVTLANQPRPKTNYKVFIYFNITYKKLKVFNNTISVTT
jgi:hypothetical protein